MKHISKYTVLVNYDAEATKAFHFKLFTVFPWLFRIFFWIYIRFLIYFATFLQNFRKSKIKNLKKNQSFHFFGFSSFVACLLNKDGSDRKLYLDLICSELHVEYDRTGRKLIWLKKKLKKREKSVRTGHFTIEISGRLSRFALEPAAVL